MRLRRWDLLLTLTGEYDHPDGWHRVSPPITVPSRGRFFTRRGAEKMGRLVSVRAVIDRRKMFEYKAVKSTGGTP